MSIFTEGQKVRRAFRTISSELLIFCWFLYLVCFGGFDELFEQRSELAGAPEILGVPLDGDAEAGTGTLDRFDDAVWRGCGNREPFGGSPDGLMMPAVDLQHLAVLQLLLHDTRKRGARRHPHLMRECVRRGIDLVAVRLIHLCGDILDERAPCGDVDH